MSYVHILCPMSDVLGHRMLACCQRVAHAWTSKIYDIKFQGISLNKVCARGPHPECVEPLPALRQRVEEAVHERPLEVELPGRQFAPRDVPVGVALQCGASEERQGWRMKNDRWSESLAKCHVLYDLPSCLFFLTRQWKHTLNSQPSTINYQK